MIRTKSVVNDFTTNIQELYDNGEVLLKIPKSLKKSKHDIKTLVLWLLRNKHEDRWSVSNSDGGDAWVNYNFGNYNTRLILISKQLHKKKFKKIKDIKYILKIRQNDGLFRENKPLFTGETYNQRYKF